MDKNVTKHSRSSHFIKTLDWKPGYNIELKQNVCAWC